MEGRAQVVTLEGADGELAHGNGTALGKEGADAQVRVDAVNLGRVGGTVRVAGDEVELDVFGHQALSNRVCKIPHRADCLLAGGPEFPGHLVRQHLLEPEAEQMWRVAAVRARDHVAAKAGRAPRPAVTAGAAVGQAGA